MGKTLTYDIAKNGERPFSRIMYYKLLAKPPGPNVYALVKHRETLRSRPSLYDKFFYSIPVRSQHQTTKDNCILAFACKSQADYYCQMLNQEDIIHLNNHNEPKVLCKVDEVHLPELSYSCYNLGIKLCLVCNSFCDGQSEPTFDVMLFDQPYEQKQA